ncbi:hypothetical protein BC831DRAFT_509115 [Entophlyctis helioformis]|nr:hypothetical protein BC831DRAFT_509115 [Entophlyctis helioformis]
MAINQAFVTVAPWIRYVRPAFHRQKFGNYVRSLATWGVFGGVAALYFLEPTPLARRDIFVNLPVVGSFWQKKLDAAQQAD